MTDSLFAQTEGNDNTSYRDLLVGEGKKFKTDEDLAKGKHEADQFIARLEDENENLRKELATRQRLEEVLDQLGSSSLGTPHQNQDTSTTPAAIDENLINNILDKREKERVELRNLDEVKTKLQQTFGDDFKRKLEDRAATLGMTKADLDALAKRSPKAFMALVAPTRASDAPYSPPPSSLTRMGVDAPRERTWAWYQELKKKDPSRYWSPAVQNQMHKDAIQADKEGRDF